MKEKTLRDSHGGGGIRLDMRKYTIVIMTVVLVVILSVTTEAFTRPDNIYSVIYAVSFSAIASIGFTYLMIMGEIDLSVGAVYCFSGAFTGVLVMEYDFPLPIAIAVVLLLGAGIGLSIGILVTYFRLNSMMVTLGYMSMIQAFANMGVGEIHKAYARVYRDIVTPEIANINWTIYLMIAAIVILEILLQKSAGFRKIFIVGQSLETARIYGIKAARTKLMCFMLSSVCATFAGILGGARVGSPQIETGRGLEFLLVTAAVLGGASLFGGKGSILMTFVGLLFLQLVTNGLNIYGVETVAHQIFVGLLLVIAIFLDSRMNSENVTTRLKNRPPDKKLNGAAAMETGAVSDGKDG